MHLREPTERFHKMLFDILCGPQKGRRSIFSLHNSSGNVCVPILELPPSLREMNQLTDLNTVIANASAYQEDTSIWEDETRLRNYYMLKEVSNYSVKVLHDYYSLPIKEFTTKLFTRDV